MNEAAVMVADEWSPLDMPFSSELTYFYQQDMGLAEHQTH